MEWHRLYGGCALIEHLMLSSPVCLICGSVVKPCSDVFSLDYLFSLWQPIVFSETVLEEHKKQASATQLFTCKKCSLQAFFPQIIGTPNFYVEAYGLASRDRVPDFTYSEEKWDFEQALRDAKVCTSLIEFGCGPGYFLSRAKAMVPRVCGLEYNEPAVERARAAGFDVYDETNDLAALEGSFDAAFSFHVLEHVSDPLGFLGRLAALIRPGGRIGISVPNQEGPIRFMDPCVMNMPPHHATRWSLRSLSALAEKVGLEVHRVAFEPLLLDNHSYYSVYWVRQAIAGNSFVSGILRSIVSITLRAVFQLFRLSGMQYFPWLKGLSIYLLLVKPKPIAVRGE
jgi:SAM-dependent methyltransferase